MPAEMASVSRGDEHAIHLPQDAGEFHPSQLKGQSPVLGATSVGSSTPSAGLSSNTDHQTPVPIAVCGMAMRLPGGISSGDEFWDFLVNKKDARDKVPLERYNADAFHGEGHHGYFLKDVDLQKFDASLFRVSRFELERMDPQHRLLLELTKECLETAGETNWRGKQVGCYVGTWGDDWKEYQTRDRQESGMATVNGHADFMMANKISFEYDFRGPSLTTKTACSSALVALDVAFRDLQAGEATSAIVGGANMLMSPITTTSMYQGGLLSTDDSCKTFDASANGYARAEAINMVYLKRLDDAVRDGNPIRAVIRSVATNHDGNGDNQASMYYPSSEGQEALIRSCYKAAGLHDFAKTAHFECHGTGTPAGDPVETKAIANVWQTHGGITIGSSKPNLGHSEGASGLTSLIKSVLSLENKTIPPNIKFQKPSPKIPFDKGLRVLVEPTPFPNDRRERISINAFGLGGSNAHVIIDSAESFGISGPEPRLYRAPSQQVTPRLLLFTANQNESVKMGIKAHADYISRHPEALEDMAYTMAHRREHHPWRSFAISDATSSPEYCAPVKTPKTAPEVAFVFTGQGAQWAAMGAKLVKDFPSVSQDLALMDSALASLGPDLAPSWSLEDELSKPKETSSIAKAEFSQPLCNAVQMVVVNLLRSWGVQPNAVVGHSSGEIAAAYAAGALTMEQAIISSYTRGHVTKHLTRPGGMAAVGLGRDAVVPFLTEGVVIACENSPRSVTISGDEEKIDQVLDAVKKVHPDITARRLHVDKAYHSHHMKEVGAMYEETLSPHVSKNSPSVPFFSSVTNEVMSSGASLDAAYWRANMESPVLFNTAVAKLLKREKTSPNSVMIEIGPHSALAGPVRQILKEANAEGYSYIPTLQRNEDDTASVLRTAGQLFQQGVSLDFTAIMPKGRPLANLPNYPWNREGKFWRESRLVSEWRLRRFPHHEILGSLVMESSKTEPMWRNMLKVEDAPWLRDHMIDRDVVLPGAAYVYMACEAMRQVSDDTTDDYSLRNITISAPLTLPESSATEVLFVMRPVRLTRQLDSSWYEFTVSSHNGTSWVRHCAGQVRAGPDSLVPESRQINDLPRAVNATAWYQTARGYGMHFGPRFQGLTSDNTTAHPLEDKVVAHINNNIPDVKQPEIPSFPHAITIDYCFQLFPQSTMRGLNRRFRGLKVPTFIGEMYLKRPSPNGRINVEVEAEETCKGDLVGNALGVNDHGQVVLNIRETKLSPLGEEQNNMVKDSIRLQWKPDIDFKNLETLITCERDPQANDDIRLQQKLLLLCCIEANARLSVMETTSIEHMEKFRQWIAKEVRIAETEGYLLVDETPELLALGAEARAVRMSELAQQLQGTKLAALATGVKRVCDTIEDTYSGRRESLEILREDDLLTRVYNLTHEWKFNQFLQLLGHRTPNLKVLEIGAGTGGTTTQMLEGLVSDYGERLYGTYVFSDISAGFFPAAKERFANYQGIQFQTLDVSQDPADQGYELGSFDLIIAANVIHATPSLNATLKNVRKLLRPNGKLLLQELQVSAKSPNFVTGGLAGWWMGAADGRPEEPYVDSNRWRRELARAGFDGGSIGAVVDEEKPFETLSVIVATPNPEQAVTASVSILSTQPDGPVAKTITTALQNKGMAVNMLTLDDKPVPGMISIMDLEGKAVLEDISEEEYQKLKEFLLAANGEMLWLTKPCQVKCTEPQYATSIGFLRVLDNELPMSIATLEMDEFESSGAVDAIFKIYQRLHLGEPDASDVSIDREYAWTEGQICIPRFHWFSATEELTVQPHDLGTEKTYKALDVGKRGSLKTLRWVEKPVQEPQHGEVLVEMRAVGINFKDILVAMGIVEANMGLDGSGIVKSVGPGVTDLQVGDRVGLLGEHLFATDMTIKASYCFKIPEGLSFEDAATMPSALCTSTHSLLNLGKLEAGQTVLIHSACGGTGMAAVQVAQMIGAEVFATVGNDEKVEYLMSNFGIPRDHIFNSRNSSFLPNVLKMTEGRGVDVVLNSLSGELLHASWQCVAEFGCMLELGKRDFIGQGRLAMDTFEENRSFFGVNMSSIHQKRPKLMAQIVEQAIGYYTKGVMRPIRPVTVYDAADIESAFRGMQKGTHMGKLVIRMPEDSSTLQTSSARRNFSLRPDVSYFLAGGLGGLGRSVSTWMAERGAKNLVFLSRSGGKRPEDAALVAELEAAGCTAQIFPGSVGSLADIENAVANARLPVAGVLQMSMVLKDRMFENTPYQDWTDVVEPKVPGTWNLHKALEKHILDFFVLFSSSTGVAGYKGQANYAAAGAFLDAFVQARHSQGLPASVIDVGPVEDVGYVNQNPDVQAKLRQNAIYFVTEQGVLDGLELAMKKSAPAASSDDPLSATGYVNSSQFCLGFRSTMPLMAPNNRLPWKRDPRTALYRNIEDAGDLATGGGGDASDGDAKFKLFMAGVQADPGSIAKDETVTELAHFIGVALCGFMMKPAEDVDVSAGVSAMGVDSLVAIELKNWFRQRLALDVSVLEITTSPSLVALARLVAERAVGQGNSS